MCDVRISIFFFIAHGYKKFFFEFIKIKSEIIERREKCIFRNFPQIDL